MNNLWDAPRTGGRLRRLFAKSGMRADAHKWVRRTKIALTMAASAPLLGGCKFALLDPKGPFALLNPQGPIGVDERDLIYYATVLMLVIALPTIFLTLLFAWRYRSSNTSATYKPKWSHSTAIEVVCWAAPCLIIVALGAKTWTSTHELDPYRPIASDVKPLKVDVVSLNWKWLFIYPDLGVASVNELAFPKKTPVRFHLTSTQAMNAFWIPRLGTQIYTMAGMETKLSLLADKTGTFEGLSTNFSGDGFTRMYFKARSMTDAGFKAWVAKARGSKTMLTRAAYRELSKPSENVPPVLYSQVAPKLYHDILNICTDGQTCIDKEMLTRAGQLCGKNVVASNKHARGATKED